jgi:hypothetical protein
MARMRGPSDQRTDGPFEAPAIRAMMGGGPPSDMNRPMTKPMTYEVRR